MEDFEFIIQYCNNEPLQLNTNMIQENVIRLKMGLESNNED